MEKNTTLNVQACGQESWLGYALHINANSPKGYVRVK